MILTPIDFTISLISVFGCLTFNGEYTEYKLFSQTKRVGNFLTAANLKTQKKHPLPLLHLQNKQLIDFFFFYF
jgi:hypothetical protein